MRERSFRMYEQTQALKHLDNLLRFDERFELEVVRDILAVIDEEDMLALAWQVFDAEDEKTLRVGNLCPGRRDMGWAKPARPYRHLMRPWREEPSLAPSPKGLRLISWDAAEVFGVPIIGDDLPGRGFPARSPWELP